MFRKLYAFAAFFVLYSSLLLFPALIQQKLEPVQVEKRNPVVKEIATYSPESDDFNPEFQPPEWWIQLNRKEPQKYPLFKLSKDYPIDEPTSCPINECRWKTLDYKTQSKEYMTEVLKYAFAGNLEIDWRVQENPLRKWFHAPWMHTTAYGREFIHGLTKERRLCKDELLGNTNIPCPSEKRTIENWAVGIYNDRGAYYIGKVWQEMEKEKPDAKNFPAGGFPEDTVTIKLLFTQAGKAEEAFFLDNSFEWLVANNRKDVRDLSAANCILTDGFNPNCLHVFRLLQVDVAVRDKNAPTGWVFGTFVYHKDAPPVEYDFPDSVPESERENLRRWLKLEFVGLQFGNDENVKIGGELSETIINRSINSKQKLGCGGRMNGPVDTPVSSCMSCHALAETERNLKIATMPYPEIDKGCRNDQIPRWFRNIKPRSDDLTVKTFTKSEPNKEIISLDYSLQLREGITRYCGKYPAKCGLTNANRKNLFEVTRSGLEKLFNKLKGNK